VAQNDVNCSLGKDLCVSFAPTKHSHHFGYVGPRHQGWGQLFLSNVLLSTGIIKDVFTLDGFVAAELLGVGGRFLNCEIVPLQQLLLDTLQVSLVLESCESAKDEVVQLRQRWQVCIVIID
jgi:hypothetical protein